MSVFDVPEERTETSFQDMLVDPKVDNPDMIELYSWFLAVIAAFGSWLLAVIATFFLQSILQEQADKRTLSTTSPQLSSSHEFHKDLGIRSTLTLFELC